MYEYSPILVTIAQFKINPNWYATGTPLTSTAGWLASVTDQHRQPAPPPTLRRLSGFRGQSFANRSSSPLFIVWVFVPANHRRPKTLLVGCLAQSIQGTASLRLPTASGPLHPTQTFGQLLAPLKRRPRKLTRRRPSTCYCKTIPSHLIFAETAVIQEPQTVILVQTSLPTPQFRPSSTAIGLVLRFRPLDSNLLPHKSQRTSAVGRAVGHDVS